MSAGGGFIARSLFPEGSSSKIECGRSRKNILCYVKVPFQVVEMVRQ